MNIHDELQRYELYRTSKLNTFGVQLSDFKSYEQYMGFITWLNAKQQAISNCSCNKSFSATRNLGKNME